MSCFRALRILCRVALLCHAWEGWQGSRETKPGESGPNPDGGKGNEMG